MDERKSASSLVGACDARISEGTTGDGEESDGDTHSFSILVRKPRGLATMTSAW